MELYRVMLVDDEAQIREGIRLRVNWQALGFDLVGEAENGQEALELAESLRPDVIMTDIQMPFLTGLELCQLLTKRLPASKFVVFSGFDDFEYAKQAIRMNVFEYILKPINTAELTEVLQKLKLQLDTERADRQNLENLRQLYEDSRPVLRELFLTRLLDGRACSDRVPTDAAQHGINIAFDTWQVALIHLKDVASQRELVAVSVRQLFEQHLELGQTVTCLSFLYADGVALLAGYTGNADPYGFIAEINRVCNLVHTYLNVEVTVGVGMPCALDEIPQSTAGARSALDYRVLVGTGRAIYIGDMEPDSPTQYYFDEQDERALLSAVKLGSEQEVRVVVQALTMKMQEGGHTLAQSQLFFLELCNCLLKLTRGGNFEVADIFGKTFHGSVQITDFGSFDALGEWYLSCCLRLHALLGRQRVDSAGRTVERAKDFIATHYAQSDLSVETLCDFLHLSPAYFSTLFKRETSMNFTAYVTHVRMEAAALLLRQTEEKTYLIAERIGYEDSNYFSYVFKKHFGMTPTKYRSS